MKKYIAPSYETKKVESKDIITASLVDNGQSSYNYNGNTVTGNKGTFAGWFNDLW